MVRFYTHKKHKKNKRHQKALKAQKNNQTKSQKRIKRIKIKNALKKNLGVKKPLICLFAKKKSLYNSLVGFTNLVKVLSALYEQNLVC